MIIKRHDMIIKRVDSPSHFKQTPPKKKKEEEEYLHKSFALQASPKILILGQWKDIYEQNSMEGITSIYPMCL